MDYDNLDEIQIKIRLNEIAILIKSGHKPEKYQNELDLLLGTQLSDRNLEAESTYEATRVSNE